MPASTRDTIIDETLKQISCYPLKKVTVKQVVAACSITRNTFYYHFKDVYDVLDYAVDRKVKEISIQESSDNLDEKLFNLVVFLYDYRKIWKNVYVSMGHEEFIKWATAKNGIFFENFFDKLENSDKMNSLDREIIFGFYSEAVLSIITNWLLNPAVNDSFQYFTTIMKRVRILFNGTTALYIKNSIEHPLQE